MKVRIKATGEIKEVVRGIYSPYQYVANGAVYTEDEVEELPGDDGVILIDPTIDYRTRLEHQYAGMAMQGILSNQDYMRSLNQRVASGEIPNLAEGVASHAEHFAHALVEKLKKESK